MRWCVLCYLQNRNYYSRQLSRLVSVKESGNFCDKETEFLHIMWRMLDLLRVWLTYRREAHSFSTGSTCGLHEKSIHSHIGSFIRTAKLLVYRDCSRRGGSNISETESFIKLWFMYLYFRFSCYNYELTMTWTNVVQFSINKTAEAWSNLSSN